MSHFAVLDTLALPCNGCQVHGPYAASEQLGLALALARALEASFRCILKASCICK